MGNGWLDCVCQKCGKKFASFTLFGEDYCSECSKEEKNEKNTDNVMLTIENDAYLNNCVCPKCKEHHYADYDGRIFFCSNCGQHLEQKPFSEEEIEEARFQKAMDKYED